MCPDDASGCTLEGQAPIHHHVSRARRPYPPQVGTPRLDRVLYSKLFRVPTSRDKVSTVFDRAGLETASPASRADRLLFPTEDQWYERKSSRIAARELANEMIGFANAEGGTIAVGAHDGTIEALRWSTDRENDWRQAALDFTVPPVTVEMTALPVTGESDATILLIDIPASERLHANVRDEVYLRVGDETRQLTFGQRRELEFDKGQSNFEATTPRFIEARSLSPSLLIHETTADRLLAKTGSRDISMLLTARGLMTTDGALTVGGLLLVGEHPQAELPAAIVRVTRYRSTERTTGARQQVDFDRRFEGPLPVQLADAAEAIAARIPTRRALASSGEFSDVGAIPRDAWLEGLVNAVAHRSYSMAGDHIRVSLFPNRVEIESPGRFPGVVDLKAAEGITRFARNPRIARVLADLDFTQELGEGIRRMFEEMRLAGLAEPHYEQTAGSVRLTMTSMPLDVELERRLPPNAREILRLLRERGRGSTGALVSALGRSRPVVLGQLRALEDQGLVEWVGNSPKDPRAFWRLP